VDQRESRPVFACGITFNETTTVSVWLKGGDGDKELKMVTVEDGFWGVCLIRRLSKDYAAAEPHKLAGI
jgi:hypothetical protein